MVPDSEPHWPPPQPPPPTPARVATGPPDPVAGAGQRTHPLTGLVQGLLWSGISVFGLFNTVRRVDSWDSWTTMVTLGAIPVCLILGLASWWATWFVIDDTELRLTRGIFVRRSRRVRLERIQSVDVVEPFLARLFGLAELRVEAAGGHGSQTSVRFLRLGDTRRLRGVLLEHARTALPTTNAIAGQPGPTARLGRIAVVDPPTLALGRLLSTGTAFAFVGVIALFVSAIAFDGAQFAAMGVGMAIAVVAFGVVRPTVAQWEFTLSRHEQGLHVQHGMLSRVSQTIPLSRVQGMAVVEPLLWRVWGRQRLEVEVAGNTAAGDGAGGLPSSLLPVSSSDRTRMLVAELLEGVVTDAVSRTRAPRRSFVLAPIGWRFRWVGADATAFVTGTGWLQRTTSVVPHRKTQSVAIRQGPLQRRLSLATVQVHTPPGPVVAHGRNLDASAARQVAFAQLTRVRDRAES